MTSPHACAACLAILATCALFDHWMLSRVIGAGSSSTCVIGVGYAGLIWFMFARDLAHVRAMESARESLHLYEQTVQAYERMVVELKAKCGRES